CPKCGVVCLSREDLPLKLPEDVVFDGKGNPLDNHPTWKHVKCPKCGSDATRETDTMDTFVDSSWYFLRFVDLCDDKTINKELCDEVMPIDQYIGGIEHATGHLMYARFFTKAMRDCGYLNIDEPVKKLFNQGLLCHNAYRGKITKDWCYPKDLKKENGKFYNTTTGEELSYEGNIKMSKSKSNVIGIDGVAANYGTDSARLFLLSDTPADKDMEWSDEGINGCWRYINKIYKVIVNFRNKYDVKYDNPNNYVNDTIRYTHKVIKDVTENFEKIEFNKAIARIRELSNFFEKTTLDTQENIESYAFAIANYLKLLNPFTPHFCSEMLEILSIKDITWPSFDENLTVDDVVVIAIQVNGKLRETIEVVKDLSNGEIEARAKVEKSVVKYLDGHEIKRVVVVPNKLVNFVL
ncbi:MAG: class I tRNA ligase family protein, partial [Rickettsiales bacterium]|nr:class I tRNA ligase family protein [Rickettsiales bacterium]